MKHLTTVSGEIMNFSKGVAVSGVLAFFIFIFSKIMIVEFQTNIVYYLSYYLI